MTGGYLRRRRERRAAEDAQLLGALPGEYVIVPGEHGWQAVHDRSGGVLGPVRNLSKLASLILADQQRLPLARRR